jgi:hypothetical protein
MTGNYVTKYGENKRKKIKKVFRKKLSASRAKIPQNSEKIDICYFSFLAYKDKF